MCGSGSVTQKVGKSCEKLENYRKAFRKTNKQKYFLIQLPYILSLRNTFTVKVKPLSLYFYVNYMMGLASSFL